MSADTAVETDLVVKVEQILNGDARCHCGKDAVLLVTTEPDGEPGLTCYKHALDWIESSTHLVKMLFDPKEIEAREHRG